MPIPTYKDPVLNAQLVYAKEQNTDNLTKLLQEVSLIVAHGDDVLIPVADEKAPADKLLLQTFAASDGQVYVTAHTSEEARHSVKKDNGSVISRPFGNYFKTVLQMEGIAGIVVNPTSFAPFTIKKKMISELLKLIFPEVSQN